MPEEKRPIPPRPKPVEMKPILAGRLWIAIGILLAFALLANPLFNGWAIRQAPPEEVRTDVSRWRIGDEAQVRITVITADSARLGCASSQPLEGTHCAFGGDHMIWPRPPDAPLDDGNVDVIQPYRTSPDNRLVLLSGVWAHPEVAMRLHREPWIGVQAKRLQRFDVTCRVKFLGKLDQVDLRWDVNATWQTERGAWVGRTLDCHVNKS